MKRFYALSVIVALTLSVSLAQSRFLTGYVAPNGLYVWGSNDPDIDDLIVQPGDRFELVFGALFEPNPNTGMTRWALVSLFFDLEFQDPWAPTGRDYTSAFESQPNTAAWTQEFIDLSNSRRWRRQTLHGVQEVRDNPLNPSDPTRTRITGHGAYALAYSLPIGGGSGTDYAFLMPILTIPLTVKNNAPYGRYVFSLNRDGSRGGPPTGIRTVFATNPEDYGERISLTVRVVPEPTSVLALVSGVAGLLALRRRRN